MGQSLKDQGYGSVRGQLDDIAQANLKAAREAKLDATQTGLGVVGIADPTGVADATNAGISLARGDYFGFFLDGVSAVPYAGDAVAKPFRGVQMGFRAWRRGRKVAALARRGSKLVEQAKAMRTKAANAVKRAKRKNCKRCNNKYGTMVPTKGKWENPKNPGHGKYTVDGKTYHFKNGYPDMDHPGMQQYLRPGGNNKTSIELTGNRSHDEKLANLTAGYDKTPKNSTWHHGDDGSTMYLMNRADHQAIVPHDGGYSIAENPLF